MDIDMIDASQNSNTPTVQNQPDQNDVIDASQNSNTPTVQNQPDQNDASYSSQNSNTPTAQNQPVPNNGGAGVFKFNIRGPVHQFNPTQANQNSGTFTVNQSYKAAELDDNPTRDIPIGTGQAPGGNPTRN